MDNLDIKIAQLEKELRDSMTAIGPVHSTLIPQFQFQSDSGVVTTRPSKQPDDKTTQFWQTPIGSHFSSGARPKEKVEVKSFVEDQIVQNATPRVKSGVIPQVCGKGQRRDIRVATYGGSCDWNDYRSHFEACASINGWDEDEKGLYLAASLRGHAQGVLGDLSDDKKGHYNHLVRSLEERFAPLYQMELYRVQLKERKQRASESLPELGQTIRRLVNKAYPTAPGEVRETLAKEHFLDAFVNTEMRIKIKQARPIDLNTAVCLAVELETFYKAERKFEGGKAHLRTVYNNDTETSQVVNNVASKIEDMHKTMNEQLDNIKKELDEV